MYDLCLANICLFSVPYFMKSILHMKSNKVILHNNFISGYCLLKIEIDRSIILAL